MNEFNRMTILAAAKVIESWKSDCEMDALAFQWNIGEHIAYYLEDCALRWATCAVESNPKVMTEAGLVPLERASVEEAILAPQIKDAILKPQNHRTVECKKLIAGLRFDGFEIIGTMYKVDSSDFWEPPKKKISTSLARMLPDDIPGVDFRKAQSEVESFLESGGFDVAKGHLQRAMSAFQRGEWSSANGELRNFYESYLNEIADKLGYKGGHLRKRILSGDFGILSAF